MLQKYNESPFKLLSALFPNYKWLPWKFDHCPRNFWSVPSNQRMYMDWVAKELHITDKNDWYKVENKVDKNVCFLCLL